VVKVAAKPDGKLGTKSDATFGTRSGVKSTTDPVPNPGITTSLPTLVAALIVAPKPIAVPNFVDSVPNPHAFSEQLKTASNTASVTVTSPLPVVQLTLQPVPIPALALTSAITLSTVSLAASLPRDQHESSVILLATSFTASLTTDAVSFATTAPTATQAAATLAASNFGDAIAATVPANLAVAVTPDSLVPTEASPKSSGLPITNGDGVLSAAKLFSNVQAQPTISPAPVAPAPTSKPGLAATAIPDSPMPTIPAALTITSPAALVTAEGQLPTPTRTPASQTVSLSGPSLTVQSPSLQSVSIELSSLASSPVLAPPAAATPLAKAELSVVPNELRYPGTSPDKNQGPLSADSPNTDDPNPSVASLLSSAPTAQSSTSTSTSTPSQASATTLQSVLSTDTSGDTRLDNFRTVSDLATATLPAAPKITDTKGGSGTGTDSLDRPSGTEPAPVGESAAHNAPGARTLLSDTATARAQTAGALENGLAVGDNIGSIASDGTSSNTTANVITNGLVSNNSGDKSVSSITANLGSNSNATALEPDPVALAAATGDTVNNTKPGASALSGPSSVSATASPTTAVDKKAGLAQINAEASTQANTQTSAGPNAAPSPGLAAQNIPAAFVSGRDPSVVLTTPVPPGAASAPPAGSTSAPPLPPAQQMLDSAPPVPPPPAAAPITPGSAADLQMNAQVNAQMHVGIRTDAFGSVEIHTIVEQSQVGITVHADRDIARWFSSEVPGLEAGLNKSHLNLTAVDFDSGRSGVQTASSFQQGQQRQSYSQTPGAPYAGSQGKGTTSEDTTSKSAAVEMLPSQLSYGPAVTRVSIHA